MNRGQFITAVANRNRIVASDSEYDHIGTLVNEALHEWEVANVNGWDFLVRYPTLSTVADQASYTYGEIADAIDEEDPPTIVKIIDVDYLTATSRIPIERFSLADLRQYYGDRTAVAVPSNWAVEGEQLWVFPVPTAIYSLDLRVVIGEPDLAADEDSPLTPARYHGAIVELASALLYEEVGDDVRATARRAAFEKKYRQALAFSRPYRGPGMVRRFADA